MNLETLVALIVGSVLSLLQALSLWILADSRARMDKFATRLDENTLAINHVALEIAKNYLPRPEWQSELARIRERFHELEKLIEQAVKDMLERELERLKSGIEK